MTPIGGLLAALNWDNLDEATPSYGKCNRPVVGG
jgi:hypothetical protein